MMAITRSSFGLFLALSTASSGASSSLRTPRSLQTYTSYDDYYQQMLDAVNDERAKAGLSALCTNQKLANSAARHSKDMAENNFMAHDGSDGSTMSQRITDAGFEWTMVAENVAAGQEDVASVMTAWMNSEGHRENILGADYTMFGSSYAYNADSTYRHFWTQDFGTGETEACDSSSPTSSPSTEQPQQDIEWGSEANTTMSQKYTSPVTDSPSALESRTTESPVSQSPTESPTTGTSPSASPTPIDSTSGSSAPVTLISENPTSVAPASDTLTPASEIPASASNAPATATPACKRKKYTN